MKRDSLFSNSGISSKLARSITKRQDSLFRLDIEASTTALKESIDGSSVLVIGAAGSIGSAFVKQLVHFAPRSLYLVDISENNLVELVRELRHSAIKLPDDFQTFSLGLGSNEFDCLLEELGELDTAANFAALKHVRAERDPFTLKRMLSTNVLDVEDLLARKLRAKRFFSVSSDKAVNPASMMGASKALMEQVMLAHSERTPITSCRFANVAFSDGSLLKGFLFRLQKRQPLSGPSDVKRYFVSEEEAGELCLLACFLAQNREFFVPRLNPEEHLIDFPSVAAAVLGHFGLEPEWCHSEAEAKEKAAAISNDVASWPCCFGPSDTSGEKPYEEFVRPSELVNSTRFQGIDVVAAQMNEEEREKLLRAMAELRSVYAEDDWQERNIPEIIQQVVIGFKHIHSNRSLDEKM